MPRAFFQPHHKISNSLNGFIKTKWTREFCPSNICRSFELVKTQMALMHWDYIDRLGKSNSIRTAIQENIYDDNIHFIGINNCNASLKVRAIPTRL
jgi:hypothetical protein